VGFFVTFEGPEGSGKSTQIRLLKGWLREQGLEVIATREPGGTHVGEHVRAILLDPTLRGMTAETEVLLFSASRAQLVQEVIRPHLQQGGVVICDRFADSTYAYQGYGRGLNMEQLRQITAFATGGLKPDLTFLIDVPVQAGLARKRNGSGRDDWNRMEQEVLAYHERVRLGYMRLARQDPERWVILDGQQPIDLIQERIREIIRQRLHLNGSTSRS